MTPETFNPSIAHIRHGDMLVPEGGFFAWRARVAREGGFKGLPRVHASCDFRAPLRCEDEVEKTVDAACTMVFKSGQAVAVLLTQRLIGAKAF